MDYTEYSYNQGRLIAESKSVSSDVIELVEQLDFEYGTSGDFGKYFREGFERRDWEYKGQVVPELTIRFGFRKEGIGVETQFSNVARFYSDIFKLELSYNRDLIDAGILILPTKKHANQIGSNLAYFERAKEELVHSRPMYSIPLWVIGIKLPI